MRSEILETWSALECLEPEWNLLLRCSRSNTLFLTWEWIAAWARVVAGSVTPLVVVVRDDHGRLVGLGPFYRTELTLLGTLSYATLRILGDYPTGAEYPDWIARRDCEGPVGEAIASALARAPDRWDCIWMPGAPDWSGAPTRVRGACEAAGFRVRERPTEFATLELPSRVEDYVAALSRKTQRRLKTTAARLHRRDGIRVVHCDSADQIPAFLDALFDLHHRRWKLRGDQGTFRRKPSEAAFYREFAPLSFARGWLRITALQEHGIFKAVHIGHVYDRTYHAMQEGFDPDYVSGVGNYLRVRLFESCIAEGVHFIDMLGEWSEHKRRLLAQPRAGRDLLIARRCAKNAPLLAAGIWPTGRLMEWEGLPGSTTPGV
jgi:CelD/BcsL family acetyltransferase involved in cellulose biosynthesis